MKSATFFCLGLLLAPLCSVFAAYNIRWTPIDRAFSSGKPVLVYRVHRAGHPATMDTEYCEDLSLEYPFAKFEIGNLRSLSEQDRRILGKLDLKDGELALCDEHGNELRRFTIYRISESFMTSLFEQVPDRVKRLRDKMRKLLKDAKYREEKERYVSALKRYREVFENYFGYPEIDEAEEGHYRILSTLRDKIREQERSSDRVDALRTLKRMEREYRGTELEEDLREAVASLEKK